MRNPFRISVPVCLRPAPLLALLSSALLVSACASASKAEKPAPESAEISKSITAKAEIVSVDKDTRVLVLRNEKGETMRVRAGEEVRNFGQIQAGDTVRV